MSHSNKFRVPISSFPQCWAAVKSCRQVVTLQWMDSNAKHLTYNPPNSAKVALANALTTCANEEEPGTPIKASTSNCIWEISPGPRGRDISWSSIVDLITSDGLAAKEKLRFKDDHFLFSLCAAWERETLSLLALVGYLLFCLVLASDVAKEMSFPQLGYPQYLSASQAVYGGDRPGVLTPSSRGGSAEIGGSASAAAAAVSSVLGMYPYAHNYSAFLPYTSADLALFSQMVRKAESCFSSEFDRFLFRERWVPTSFGMLTQLKLVVCMGSFSTAFKMYSWLC